MVLVRAKRYIWISGNRCLDCSFRRSCLLTASGNTITYHRRQIISAPSTIKHPHYNRGVFALLCHNFPWTAYNTIYRHLTWNCAKNSPSSALSFHEDLHVDIESGFCANVWRRTMGWCLKYCNLILRYYNHLYWHSPLSLYLFWDDILKNTKVLVM